ncbi:leucine-rich repeat and guanylate kinase domain-containing protein [Elysia marginata]|uniref:Leucine-rich repeat and guanylate kinase domain-containing protein n=1 Tax=Elysia marginata TaxID=1093978 RepID=A0AAV4HDY7_9GAST|nr:leucine-rich repeat and guanylate kinase domain-containing protein [Elysia marginata]
MESPYPDGNYDPVLDGENILETETDILKLDDGNFEPVDTEITFENEKMDPIKDENNSAIGEEEQDEIELSPGGVLDEETIARGLSNLGRSATGDYQVYLDVTIPGFSLTDIGLLVEYEHIQKVEIPYNDISDLSPLGKLKYLLILDASHNNIETLLDFEPPKNLQVVNLSYNKIKEMKDLSAHKSLRKLVLDIMTIHWTLAASDRRYKLVHRTLTASSLCYRVKQKVIDIVEINHIKEAKHLRDLNLLRNPIQELPDYRLSILFRIRRLTSLDRRLVKENEKVAAVNMFDPPMEVVAARDHIMHVVYSFLQPSRVWDSTLPNIETPYPMLVLVGPQGSGKKDLAMKLVDEFGDYFGYGTSHSTRRARPDEVAGKDYYFVSLEKFEMDIKMGQFIQTYQYNENWYGLQMESIETVAREGLACVVHMELEGVLTLKNTYLEPRYVLILPLNSEDHERRLRERGIYTEEQIARTLKRADMYVQHNQEHPGFFDMMICSDDISEAYRQMRRLVMDYLGVSATTPASTAAPYTITDTREATEAFQTPFAAVPGVGGVGSVGGAGGPALSNQMGARTWSKPSIPDSLSQRGTTRVGSGAPVSRGIVEEESIKRRHSAAKDVVSGYVPPLYEQLLTSYPKTAPQSVDQQVGLGEDAAQQGSEPRALSAPLGEQQQTTVTSATATTTRGGNQHQTPRGGVGASGVGVGTSGAGGGTRPLSADSSSSDASSSTNLSDLDSATELQQGGKGRSKGGGAGKGGVGPNNNSTTNNAGAVGGGTSRGLLPTEKVNPLELIDEQGYSSANSRSRAAADAAHPRPISANRPDSAARPGSDRHAVLPPIQNAA